jgi:hypothetical protein
VIAGAVVGDEVVAIDVTAVFVVAAVVVVVVAEIAAVVVVAVVVVDGDYDVVGPDVVADALWLASSIKWAHSLGGIKEVGVIFNNFGGRRRVSRIRRERER